MKKINSYELGPGDIVSDMELSKELGISRTPVREAIFKLISDGILERTPTRVIVKPLTFADIQEILQIREALEIASAKLIIDRGGLTDAQYDELCAMQQQFCTYVADSNYGDNFSNDSDFHRAIVEFSGNSRMISIFRMINWQAQRLRVLTLFTPQRYQDTAAEHQAIIDALHSKDISFAESALHAHFQATIANYAEILESPHWGRVLKGIISMSNIADSHK